MWLAYVLIFLYGLGHTPLLVDLLRQLFPHWNVKRVTSHYHSFILILLILFVFLLSLGIQMFVFLPLVPAQPLHIFLHCLFAYWVWVNAFLNYTYTLCSRPGLFASLWDNRSSRFHDSNQSESNTQREKLSDSKEPVNNVPKSNCSNHHLCKICGTVIPYRDHHCPFTGNCIGLHNYSYFFLSLLYSMVGLGYEVSVFFVYFSECSFLTLRIFYSMHGSEVEGVCLYLEPYAEGVLPTIGAFVTVSILVSLQVFMLMTDVSTHQLLKQWKTIKLDVKKFLNKDSRFRVMLLNQRKRYFHFLLPLRNVTIQRNHNE